MKKYKLIILIVLFTLLVLSGCLNDKGIDESAEETTKDSEVMSESKQEELRLALNHLTHDEDITEIKANITTNLPIGTFIDRATLINPDGELVSIIGDFSIEDSSQILEFGLPDKPTYLVDGNYSLSLVFTVNEEILKSLLKEGKAFDDELIGLTASAESSTKYLAFPLEGLSNETGTTNKSIAEEIEKEEEAYLLVTADDILQRYDDLLLTKIEVKGDVTQVIQHDEYAISEGSKSYLINISDPNYSSAANLVWIEIISEHPTIVEGSSVAVRGTLGEPYTYSSVSRTNETVPYILADSISVN